jgi:hypothetical protein
MNVVNKRTHEPGPNDVYIGRPSPLGNPYRLSRPDDRAAVIAAYRTWLREQVRQRDPEVMRALRALTEQSVLVCWCKPLVCHGDVIVEAWQAMKRVGWM